MIHAPAKPLPHIDNILWLTKVAGPFPATTASILDKARLWGFNQSTQEFLKRFPADETFETRADFLIDCAALELFLREERDVSQEHFV